MWGAYKYIVSLLLSPYTGCFVLHGISAEGHSFPSMEAIVAACRHGGARGRLQEEYKRDKNEPNTDTKNKKKFHSLE